MNEPLNGKFQAKANHYVIEMTRLWWPVLLTIGGVIITFATLYYGLKADITSADAKVDIYQTGYKADLSGIQIQLNDIKKTQSDIYNILIKNK